MLQSIFRISQSLELIEQASQSIRLPDITSQYIGLPKNISHSLGLPNKYFYFFHRLTEINVDNGDLVLFLMISSSSPALTNKSPTPNILELGLIKCMLYFSVEIWRDNVYRVQLGTVPLHVHFHRPRLETE